MKQLLFILLVFFCLTACEEVIEIDLNESAPKLVIDASVTKNIETNDAVARVRLTTTKPFFDNGPTDVNNASVTITDDNGVVYVLPGSGNGYYGIEPFNVEPGIAYTLEVIFNGESYIATEMLEPVASLDFVEQRNDGGFSGEDIELKAFFTDPLNTDNYYFFEGLSERGDFYDTFNDEFFDGNTIFGYYLVEDLSAGDEVTFYLHGVDASFYNFMFVLLQQSSDQSDGPFETQAATVRGNLVNTTQPDNFPLGYFRISEVSTLTYTVQ
ncbi:uncharacterized protein DUF4249 [Ulvibacter sp. MAR_2010_11]|uniref:DUF4249 domain-containing protein n=1 Tax=Ulvibacter sp. MAR_2010_11 TaxID=1250229 RepID=UPI000C2C9A0A|nr:DUF4249 domain-containing protein [Ulvibacter sp. MAR_2010_11]PKA81925.1 uncharacterized protein DUF4249 [Ulvibacter sp. MAR_2010_11]